MSDIKISDLPPAQIANDADIYAVVQSANTRKQTLAQLKIALGVTAANLAALAGLTGAANKAPLFTGPGAMTVIDVSPFIQTVADDTTALAARATLGVQNVSPGYIDGLGMVWNSAASLTISLGCAWIPSLGGLLTPAATITKPGLTLTAATWYHAYLYSNAGTPDVEIVTTAPSAPYFGTARTKTGDTSRRYLGSVLSGAANTMLRFKHTAATGRVSYAENTGAAPFNVVQGGQAVASTAVSCAAAVPASTTHASLSVLNGAAAAVNLVLANPDPGTAASASFFQLLLPQNSASCVDFLLGASQNFLYIFTGSPSTGGAFIRVYGYLFER